MKKIDSLQTVRAVAFLGVFLAHTGIELFSSAGRWGVSVFFVLSGFVLFYGYYEKGRIQQVSIKDNIRFAANKIKPLYWLYFITTMAFVVFGLIGENRETLGKFLLKLLLNIFMIPAWLPIKYGLNDVAWYLYVAIFLYFVFPWILKRFETNYSNKKAKVSIIVLFIIQIIISFLVSQIPSPKDTGGWLLNDFTAWLGYRFPLTRVIDFIIGCNLGYIFLKKDEIKEENSNLFYTVAECITIMLIAFGITISNILQNCYTIEQPSAVSYPERWWMYTIIYTPSSCMLVYLFAKCKGKLSNFLTNRVTIYLGNISMYTFLIFNVIFIYMEKVLYHVNILDPNRFVEWINLFIGFPLTIIATKIWLKLIRKDIRM